MLKVRLLPWLALPLFLISGLFVAGADALPQENAKAKARTAAFANPDLLVTTEWLAKHGKDRGVVVLDARSAQDFAKGHIPGARSFSTRDSYDPQVRWQIGSSKQIASQLSSRGVQASSHVVIYDRGRDTSAARLFWTLEVYGHAKVSVLDGGAMKWEHEKRGMTKSATKPKTADYKPGARPERCATMDQVLDDVEDPDAVMLDSRTVGEFNAGRIPGAVRIEWTENYTSDPVPVFKSPAALAKLYKDQGVTPDKRVHAY